MWDILFIWAFELSDDLENEIALRIFSTLVAILGLKSIAENHSTCN
jgi:hypothetical protein